MVTYSSELTRNFGHQLAYHCRNTMQLATDAAVILDADMQDPLGSRRPYD